MHFELIFIFPLVNTPVRLKTPLWRMYWQWQLGSFRYHYRTVLWLGL